MLRGEIGQSQFREKAFAGVVRVLIADSNPAGTTAGIMLAKDVGYQGDQHGYYDILTISSRSSSAS